MNTDNVAVLAWVVRSLYNRISHHTHHVKSAIVTARGVGDFLLDNANNVSIAYYIFLAISAPVAFGIGYGFWRKSRVDKARMGKAQRLVPLDKSVPAIRRQLGAYATLPHHRFDSNTSIKRATIDRSRRAETEPPAFDKYDAPSSSAVLKQARV